jgi:hypothetical protein
LYYDKLMKARRGRPKLPEHKARQVFSLRFSTEEMDTMKRKAGRVGQKLRVWARDCLLDSAGRP